MIKIIEECRASPAPGTVAELTLPLTFSDVHWSYDRNVLRPLLFYKFPLITKTSFIETFIPNLKKSISLALKHYFPLAGNLVSPLQYDSGVLPCLRYMSGVDSIPLIFAESLEAEEFGRLTGKKPRKCDDFYPLIPVLKAPPVAVSTNSKITPLFAVQVTLFPNSGISIALVIDHVAGDANVMVSFLKAWASINKFDGDSQLLVDGLIPFYDRSVIKDPYDLKNKFLNEYSKHESNSSQVSLSPPIPSNKVRATFVLRQSVIEELKNYVLTNKPSLTRVSSFTITCAYIWTCLLKAKDEFVGDIDDNNNNVKDFFMFGVDCRSRMDPPIPSAYFGNCILPCCAASTHEELVGKDGFLVASEKIGAAIQEFVNNKEGILNGSVLSKFNGINWDRMTGVSGTTKNDFYDADFGWGKPEYLEAISIDADRVELISLNKSGREETGLEIGLSLPENMMDAFATIFATGLGETQSSQLSSR